VLDQRRLQQALKSQKFTLADLGSGEALKELSAKAGGLPAIAQGTLRSRAGRIVTLQCKLLQTNSDDLAGSVGGTAVLDESEWAMLGKSAAVPMDARVPKAPTADSKPNSEEDAAVEKMDEQAQGPHPLSDARFPFRVTIKVAGKERKGVFKGNDYFVPLRQGENYEVWIENRTKKDTMMRLLVDGLNTLPEKEDTKGISTEIIGKRVNLSEARPWYLDGKKPVNAVIGFATQTGAAGKTDLFTVVDAEKSLAARQNFSDSVGMITAAFYETAKPKTRGPIGTDRGQEVGQDLTERKGEVGKLLGVVHIRYVDAEALPAAK
jgi:hypothetical protein